MNKFLILLSMLISPKDKAVHAYTLLEPTQVVYEKEITAEVQKNSIQLFDANFEVYKYNKIHQYDKDYTPITDINDEILESTSKFKYMAIDDVKIDDDFEIAKAYLKYGEVKFQGYYKWDSLKGKLLGDSPSLRLKPIKVSIALKDLKYRDQIVLLIAKALDIPTSCIEIL